MAYADSLMDPGNEMEFSDMLDDGVRSAKRRNDMLENFGEVYSDDHGTMFDNSAFEKENTESAMVETAPNECMALLRKALGQVVLGDFVNDAVGEPNEVDPIQSLVEEAPMIFCPGFATAIVNRQIYIARIASSISNVLRRSSSLELKDKLQMLMPIFKNPPPQTQDATRHAMTTETPSLHAALEFRLWQLMRKVVFNSLKPKKRELVNFLSCLKGSSGHEETVFVTSDSWEFDEERWVQNSTEGTLFDETHYEYDHDLIRESKEADLDDPQDIIDEDEFPEDKCEIPYDAWDDFEALDDRRSNGESVSSILDEGLAEDDFPCSSRVYGVETLSECVEPHGANGLLSLPITNFDSISEMVCNDELRDAGEELSEGLLSDGEDLRDVGFSSQSTADEMLDGF